MRIFPAPTKASSGGPEGRAVFARPEHRSNRALTGQKLPGPRMIMMRVKAGCWSRQPSPIARRVAPAEAEPSAFRIPKHSCAPGRARGALKRPVEISCLAFRAAICAAGRWLLVRRILCGKLYDAPGMVGTMKTTRTWLACSAWAVSRAAAITSRSFSYLARAVVDDGR